MGRLINILLFLCLFIGSVHSTESYAMINHTEIGSGVDVEVLQLKAGDLTLQVNPIYEEAVFEFGAHYTIISEDGSVIYRTVNTMITSFDLPIGQYRIYVFSPTFFAYLEITI